MEEKIIGKTSVSHKEANTTTEFYFWVAPGITINPFDFVKAEHFDGSYTIGVVDEIFAYSDADSHITNYISHDLGNVNSKPLIERLKVWVAKATVLANIRNDNSSELLMPVPPNQNVYFADSKSVEKALGFEQISGLKIPAGLIPQSNGSVHNVYLDSDYLLGPEGAHVNITGISGLATKTSYAMFLINSIYQTFKENGKNVAMIIFNVKHSDLLHIHESPDDLNDDDRDKYRKLGLSERPLLRDKIKYYLPRKNDGGPDSDNPPDDYKLYAYELRDVYKDLDLLFAELNDPYNTINAFTSFIRDYWKDQEVRFRAKTVSNWKELKEIDEGELSQTVYHQKSHPTPGRIKRELGRLLSYSIFVQSRSNKEVYLGNEIKNNISTGDISVIDIYRVPTINQGFVVGNVMRKIEELYRENELSKLDALIIFIDELNTFAPDISPPNEITEHIIEIARKGRGRKTALFGVQQFKSEVHSQVWGNCSLHVIGKVGSSELATTPYRDLPLQAKNSILNLRKGEVMLSFKIWRTPIKVIFPKPPYKRMK